MNDARILHVVTGPSFLNFVGGVFDEVAPGANHVVGVGFDLTHVALPDAVTRDSVPFGSEATAMIVEKASRAALVIFHGVQNPVIEAFAQVPPGPLVVWSGWGGDFYGNGFNPSAGLLGPLTSRLVRTQTDRSYWIDRAIEWKRLARVRRQAARRAEYFSAPIPEDFAVFTRRFRQFAGAYIQLNYASIEDTISRGHDRISGRDILVGNSASAENNHLDVFEHLRHQELGDARVITPLSYGSPAYRDAVVSRGQDLFGDRFVPLVSSLPLDEYHDVMAGCSVVVMGHYRQQGLGNVLRALWQGSHVVLDDRNPVKRYLSSRGVVVNDLHSTRFGELASNSLGSREIVAHREMLRQYWSRETVVENVRAVVALAGL